MVSLRNDMQEYTESDEELIVMRDSFGRRNTDAQDLMKEKSMKRQQLMGEIQRVRDELAAKTVAMGGLEEAKRANERSLSRREEVVKEVARKHGYRGMEVIMDDAQIDEIKVLLLQSLKEEKKGLDKIKVLLHLRNVVKIARLEYSRESP